MDPEPMKVIVVAPIPTNKSFTQEAVVKGAISAVFSISAVVVGHLAIGLLEKMKAAKEAKIEAAKNSLQS